MALQSTVMRGLACANCRQWALRSFIASIGGQSAHPPTPQIAQRRTFSRPTQRLNEARERFQKEEEHALNEINEIQEGPDAGKENIQTQELPQPATAQVTHVPWYLQHQVKQEQPETPLSSRQKIPDLPDYSPSILQSLLEHVSVELGMDDINLLDLRQLDPPPALGANLLMIVGTARSEKHLHVSADRLCRWLRTEYKMSPFADGLLGRNELKLKMRRKAKRARLMSAVGAKASNDGEVDDGIRTGWVCVNLGQVEGGELPESVEKVQRAEGIVGFGARSSGCNIVVQMMTEEKREEIGLEKLWTGIMKRARRENEGLEVAESVEQNSETGAGDLKELDLRSDTANTHPFAQGPASDVEQQLRA